jgi:hypothetical protein
MIRLQPHSRLSHHPPMLARVSMVSRPNLADSTQSDAGPRAIAPTSSLSRARLGAVAWILRCAAALVFAGHGALAVSVNASWLPFFSVVGISEDIGRVLMPLVGVLDIALALLVVARPIPIALAWMTVWAFWTALLRPLSGQSVLDFFERGANWGAPLALLLLLGVPKTLKAWFRPL